ncbi:MAG: PAS domain S-box protein [Gemmatimonadales bacterium]|nr:PAS domain S-box protein [Gemmatimonadales bacterium]MDZ4389608.1 PAS domain S-box protein [Gemmatimonadales bacterium]
MTRQRSPARQKQASTIGDDAFRLLFLHHPVATWVYDVETLAFLEVNDATVRQYGFSRDELLGMTIKDLRPPDDAGRLQGNIAGGPEESNEATEKRHLLKDGRMIEVRLTSRTLEFRGRKAALASAEDITERKRQEREILAARSELKATLDAIPDLLFEVGLDGRYYAYHSLGTDLAPPEKFLGKMVSDVLPPSAADVCMAALREANEKGLSIGKHFELQLPHGRSWFEFTVSRKFAAAGQEPRFIVLLRDITERIRAEAEIRLQSAALNAAANPIVITDRSGTIVWINAAFTKCTGYGAGEAIGMNPRDLVKSGVHDRAFYKNLWDTVLAGNVWHGEMTNRRKDGSLYPEDQTITPVKDDHGEVTHFIAIKQDLTEEKQLRTQFLQAQKMESVGRLAAGIAHDLNNLLTVINATADLASTTLSEDDPLRTDLQDIHRAGDRAAALTRQLLAFSRKEIVKPDVLDLSTVVADLQGMLPRLIGEDIGVVVVPAKELGSVLADRGQIEQVILNLAVNARDAMPTGGTLTITTQDVELDEAFAARHPSVVSGPHVMLAVSDTGVGMDEATRMRIWEPFFTTKEPGKGTGLGLSTVYGIVKQSGGSIWVDSELGRGTTFTIYLPRVEKVAQQRQPTRSAMPVHGTETILIVDDEEALRRVATRIVESAGYTVLTAANGGEALRLLECHDGPVHLMLTDVVMPGMSGTDLAARIVDTRPQMKVLYTSGYTDDAILQRGVLNAAMHFIHKPYTMAELTRKVREVLDS